MKMYHRFINNLLSTIDITSIDILFFLAHYSIILSHLSNIQHLQAIQRFFLLKKKVKKIKSNTQQYDTGTINYYYMTAEPSYNF